MKYLAIALSVSAFMLFSGCATKNCENGECGPLGGKLVIPPPDSKPYHTKIMPNIGSKTDDERIVRDFGVVLRITIFPYEAANGDLIDTHNIRTVVREPKWVVGDKIPPVKRKKGLTAYTGAFPFTVRPSELDGENNVATDENIKTFQNALNDINKNPSSVQEKISADAYDEQIFEFLKQKK